MIPALRIWRQEDWEFKVILSYIVNLRPAWDVQHPVLKNQGQEVVYRIN